MSRVRHALAAVASLLALPAAAQAGPPPGAPAAGPFGGARGPAYDPPPPRGSDPYGWEQPLVDGFDVLYVDEAPLPLSYYVPAGGPLQRHTSRPGAWYTAVFLPLAPGWPVQVWLWQRTRTHEVRVTALDASPGGTLASVAVPVPLMSGRVGGRVALSTTPLALPPASQADGVFLLIEQWSLAGDRPGPIWLQARSRIVRDAARQPWWESRNEPGSASAGPTAPHPPASPLAAPRDATGVLELPIHRRLHMP